MLQWGHGEFAVENERRTRKTVLAHLLQWGHGEFAVENAADEPAKGTVAMSFNGATANSPWRTPASCKSSRPRRGLQWGHGEFAVENSGQRRDRPRGGRLQWGHGEFAVENAGTAAALRSTTYELQWGHGEFAVENAELQRGAWSESGSASMGPRRIRRGEPPPERGPGQRRGKLQWGHGEFAVENEPTRHRCASGRVASMGPRRIRRGEPVPPAAYDVRRPGGFNGATANSPWRTRTGAPRPDRADRLQWGHGEFAVENGRRAHSARRGAGGASMGPRRIRRGELRIVGPGLMVSPLQWGHGEFAVENEGSGLQASGQRSASMGPRRIRRGEPGAC